MASAKIRRGCGYFAYRIPSELYHSKQSVKSNPALKTKTLIIFREKASENMWDVISLHAWGASNVYKWQSKFCLGKKCIMAVYFCNVKIQFHRLVPVQNRQLNLALEC